LFLRILFLLGIDGGIDFKFLRLLLLFLFFLFLLFVTVGGIRLLGLWVKLPSGSIDVYDLIVMFIVRELYGLNGYLLVFLLLL
jgi:hypothetical protein